MYTVLARKYRSQTFDDVVGQEPIAHTLKNAIKTGRVAHAYLFTGTRGVGKTTMARVLAKSLNCLDAEGPTPEPCCRCESCAMINEGNDIDVIEIDGATNNGVEQVRQLRENAILRPARARFKIYIIDEVHMLSVGAFNALLKTLEEPPDHVKFIFATTEPNKVIPTIQSRCQRFNFSNISRPLIVKHLEHVLKQEKIEYEQGLIDQLARMANGSMRDALSLIDRLISVGKKPLYSGMLQEFLGRPDTDKIYELIELLAEGDPKKLLAALEELINSGLSESRLVTALIDCMRDMMLAACAEGHEELLALTAEQRKTIATVSKKFDIAAIIYNITVLEKLRWSVRSSETSRALVEATLLRLALSEHFMNVDRLIDGAGAPAGLKKNATAPEKAASRLDIKAVRDRWEDFLSASSDALGPVIAALLQGAEPAGLDNGTLTLRIPASTAVHKKLLETNGRTELIDSLLSEHFGVRIKVRLKSEPGPVQKHKDRRRGSSPLDDPAVKTVLMGLDATITGFEEVT
jgi:DNA polymerase-3 subunit gamma/tau